MFNYLGVMQRAGKRKCISAVISERRWVAKVSGMKLEKKD